MVKTIGQTTVDNVLVHNVPQSTCFNCGIDVVDQELLNAISLVFKEKNIINGEFILPSAPQQTPNFETNNFIGGN
jgi:hypothetical protein